MVTTITKGDTQFHSASHNEEKKREERRKKAEQRAQERLAKAEGTPNDISSIVSDVSRLEDSFEKINKAFPTRVDLGERLGYLYEILAMDDLELLTLDEYRGQNIDNVLSRINQEALEIADEIKKMDIEIEKQFGTTYIDAQMDLVNLYDADVENLSDLPTNFIKDKEYSKYLDEIIEDTGYTPSQYQLKKLARLESTSKNTKLSMDELILNLRNGITKHGAYPLHNLLKEYGASEEFIQQAKYDVAKWTFESIDSIVKADQNLEDLVMDYHFDFAKNKLKELGLSDLEVEDVFKSNKYFQTNLAFTDPELRADFDEFLKKNAGTSIFELEDELNKVPDNVPDELVTNEMELEFEQAVSETAKSTDMPESAIKVMGMKFGVKALKVLSVLRFAEPVEEAVEYLIEQKLGYKGFGLLWAKAEIANLFMHNVFSQGVAMTKPKMAQTMLIAEAVGIIDEEELPPYFENVEEDMWDIYQKYVKNWHKTSAWMHIDNLVSKVNPIFKDTGQAESIALAGIKGYDWIKNMFGEEEKYEKVYGGK
tara:strand:- start:3401 stop:5017 length:1617 start_codon:yes stop_codon:yes gene_type:complete